MQTTEENKMLATIAPPDVAEIHLIVEDDNLALADSTKLNLRDEFIGFYASGKELMEKAAEITVTSVTDIKAMKSARALRLEIRKIRVEADKKRKELKDESIRKGKAIDAVAKCVINACERAENHLAEQEEYAARIEAQERAERKAKREELLKPFGVSVHLFNLEEMAEEDFQGLYEESKSTHEIRLENQRRQKELAAQKEETRKARSESIRKLGKDPRSYMLGDISEEQFQSLVAEIQESARLQAELDQARRDKEKAEADLKQAEQARTVVHVQPEPTSPPEPTPTAQSTVFAESKDVSVPRDSMDAKRLQEFAGRIAFLPIASPVNDANKAVFEKVDTARRDLVNWIIKQSERCAIS